MESVCFFLWMKFSHKISSTRPFFHVLGKAKIGDLGWFYEFASAKVKNSVKHKKVGLILGAVKELLSSRFTPKI